MPFCSFFFQLVSFCSYSPLLIICTIFHIFPLIVLFCLWSLLQRIVCTHMVHSVSSQNCSYSFPKILFKNSFALFFFLSSCNMNKESLMLDPFFFSWKLLFVGSNWLLCQDAVESSSGRVDYERKEKGSISTEGYVGAGRWKREEKAKESQRKKRLRRKRFKHLTTPKKVLWRIMASRPF